MNPKSNNQSESRLKNIEGTLEAHYEMLSEIRNMIEFLVDAQNRRYAKEAKQKNNLNTSKVERTSSRLSVRRSKEISHSNENSANKLVKKGKLKEYIITKKESRKESEVQLNAKPENLISKVIVDGSINTIFSSTQVGSMKKELVIEPINEYIDPNVSKVKIDQNKYFTSRKSNKPLVFLNTIMDTRNTNKINTTTGGISNKDCPNNIRKCENIQNSNKKNRKSQQTLEALHTLTKNSIDKEFKSYMNIEKLPGNCIAMISEYMNNSLNLILCSKGILSPYAAYKIKEINERMSFCKIGIEEITENSNVNDLINIGPTIHSIKKN